jgi:hypothetical protein
MSIIPEASLNAGGRGESEAKNLPDLRIFRSGCDHTLPPVEV